MCLYAVTGRSGHSDRTLRSVQPAHQCLSVDRTRSVALNPHWNLTILNRTLNPQGSVSTDRTRSVADLLFWNLTGVDRTLPLSVRSLNHSAPGRTRRNLLGQMN